MTEETEFDMDIKIISVIEHNSQLRVKVEHIYGIDDIGLSLEDKYIDPFTEKPKWMDTVRKLLLKKYSPKAKIPIEIFSELNGQTMSLSDMKTGKVTGFKKRLMNTLGFNKSDAEKIELVYTDPMKIRLDIIADKQLPFTKPINDTLEKYYGGTGLGFESDERSEIIELKKDGFLDSKGRPTDLMPDKQAGRKKT